MKNNLLVMSLLVIVMSHVVCIVHAQDHTIINDSIYSAILKEQRSLQILLPDNAKPGSSDKYDVIFVTDGETEMNLFSFVYKFAQSGNDVPPAIIVTIPNKYVHGENQRERDFLPVGPSNPARSGGAEKFLAFLKTELIPYIDIKYPSAAAHSIYGHSYGGWFVLYALLSEPQLFDSYYAVDPPCWWNDGYLMNMAERRLDNIPSDKIVWIAGVEWTRRDQGIDRMDSLLQFKAPKNLHWKVVDYPNENHRSIRLKAIYDGIKFSYSGYSSSPLSFHPMNGILLENKSTPVWVDNYPDLRYTVDGTVPDRTSQKVDSRINITAPARLTVKSFSNSGKYDQTATGRFELGTMLHSVPKPQNYISGGLKYTCYEGIWERPRDQLKRTPVKAGIADSTFDSNGLQVKDSLQCIFEGYFEMVKEGYYDFLLVSNYGTKIFLGDTLIIENKGFPSVESIKSFVLPLEKGFYPVRIEYVQKDKNNVFRLYYIGPETKNAAPFPLKYQYYKK